MIVVAGKLIKKLINLIVLMNTGHGSRRFLK